MQFLYDLTHSIFLMHSPSYVITLIHRFVDPIKHLRQQKVKSSCFSRSNVIFLIQLIPYFWCTHLHNSSISFIVLSIQSNIVGDNKIIPIVFFLNAICLWSKLLNIFDVITFIMNHYSSLICIFNQKLLVTAR